MKKNIKLPIVIIFAVLIALATVSGALALPVEITPTNYLVKGTETGLPFIEDIIFPLMPGAVELYRATMGSPDEYALAGSYETTWLPTGQKEYGFVDYVGGDYVAAPAYLLAKDGAAGWFFYDLTALGWTGTERISLGQLWPNQGEYSHISIYGTKGTSVLIPEPGTMILLGLGLLGVGIVARKRS